MTKVKITKEGQKFLEDMMYLKEHKPDVYNDINDLVAKLLDIQSKLEGERLNEK